MNTLIVMKRSAFRDELIFRLGQAGVNIVCSTDRTEVLNILRQNNLDNIVSQLNLKDLDAIELFLFMRDIQLAIPMVVVSFQGASMEKILTKTGDNIHFLYPPSVDRIIEKMKGENNYE